MLKNAFWRLCSGDKGNLKVARLVQPARVHRHAPTIIRKLPLSLGLQVITLCGLACWQFASAQAAQLPNTSSYPDFQQDKEQFKKYLNAPHPVKYVAFVTPGTEVQYKGKPLDGELVFEGAVQGESCYLRHLTGRAGQPANYRIKGIIAGRTKENLPWKVDDHAVRGVGGNIDVAMAAERFGRAQSEAEHEARMALHHLKTVTQFGMPLLVPQSVEWTGDRFTALFFSDQWPVETNSYKISGHVTAWTNNLPCEIRISSENWTKQLDHVVCHYRYDFAMSSYPRDFWAELVGANGRRYPGIRRRVLAIEFGNSDEDFLPGNFLPASPVTQPNVFVSSNSATFWLHQGKLVEVKLPEGNALGFGSPKRLFIILAIFLILAAGAAWLAVTRFARAQKTAV